MTPDKVRKVLGIYRRKFEEMGVDKVDYPHGHFLDTYSAGLMHCHAMLDKMEVFIQQGRMDKVYRWLGFIQGFLWSKGLYTLDDLMNHNRKDS